jgi:hypothetical protein
MTIVDELSQIPDEIFGYRLQADQLTGGPAMTSGGPVGPGLGLKHLGYMIPSSQPGSRERELREVMYNSGKYGVNKLNNWVHGVKVQFHGTIRTGLTVFELKPNEFTLKMNRKTWDALCLEHQRTDPNERVAATALAESMTDIAGKSMASGTIDVTGLLAPQGRVSGVTSDPVARKAQIQQQSDDRLSIALREMKDLVAEIARIKGAVQGGQVLEQDRTRYAQRYNKLAASMKKIRQELAEAEGIFEVVQIQVLSILGVGDE